MRDDVTMDPERPLLTVQEVAKRLRTSDAWVRAQAESGDLPGYRIGRGWRFDPIELADWLTIRRNETPEKPGPMRRYAWASMSAEPATDPPEGLELSEYVTAAEFGGALDVPTPTIIIWISTGRIPGYKSGLNWIVEKEVLAECRRIVGPEILSRERGASRTSLVRHKIASEMLDRIGYPRAVGAYERNVGTVRWVPGPESSVRRRRGADSGDDDA